MSSTGLAEQQGFGGGGHRSGRGSGDDRGDAERLVTFLKTLDGDLQEMIADQEFLTDDFRALASRAYEAGATPQIAEMIGLLSDEWELYRDQLEHHGLTGVQLEFKLCVHGAARDFYLSPGPEVPDFAIGQASVFRSRPDRPDSQAWADAAAADYLKCSDIILESLSGALGGAGAAVIEIKKMIEWIKGAGWTWMRRFFGVP